MNKPMNRKQLNRRSLLKASCDLEYLLIGDIRILLEEESDSQIPIVAAGSSESPDPESSRCAGSCRPRMVI